MSTVSMRRSARTNMYVTRPEPRRFLMIPELRQGERWKLVGVIDHPFYKKGPYLHWQCSNGKTVMINRELFYAQMSGRMEMEK